MQGYKTPSSKTEKFSPRQLRISKRRERFYRNNFLLFEIGYIFLAIPVLTVALSSVPILMFYTFVKEFFIWPIIVVATLVVFFQIIATQYFVKKYYLDYYKMSLGRYLRYRFDYRRNRSKDEEQEIAREETWYDNLDETIDRLKKDRSEQSEYIYSNISK